jgi:hypothetical protein
MDLVRFLLKEHDADGKCWRAMDSSTDLLFMSTRIFFYGNYDAAQHCNYVEIFKPRSNLSSVLQLITLIIVALLVGLTCLCGLCGMEEERPAHAASVLCMRLQHRL